MKINKLMDKLPPELDGCLLSHRRLFPVPTEIVVRDIRDPVIMDQGRVYETGLWLQGRIIASYQDLPHDQGHREMLWLSEVYEDLGDDGHVDYQLRGWRLIKHSTLITGDHIHRIPDWALMCDEDYEDNQ